MISLLCLLLVTVPRVQVTDEVYQIPANDWRWVEISLNQRPALVSARYFVQSGPPNVRAALLPKSELQNLRSSDGIEDFDPTTAAAGGELRRHTREPGEYAVVFENRAASPSTVRVRIWLEFPVATTISTRRQITVVAISFAVFFAIAGFSARRLLRAVRSGPPPA